MYAVHAFKVCIVKSSSLFWAKSPQSILEQFHKLRKNPYRLAVISSLPLASAPRQLISLLLQFCLFWTQHLNGTLMTGLFHLT